MGETETPHLYDFGICEPVTKPLKPILFILGDSRVLKQTKTNIKTFLEIVFL